MGERVQVLGGGLAGVAVPASWVMPVEVTWSTEMTITSFSRCSTRWPAPSCPPRILPAPPNHFQGIPFG